jgi:predicted Holliday junction resolvase-like endonuclease
VTLRSKNEKKRLEYEAMSYEEKQKYDETQQQRQMRKRTMRKVRCYMLGSLGSQWATHSVGFWL